MAKQAKNLSKRASELIVQLVQSAQGVTVEQCEGSPAGLAKAERHYNSALSELKTFLLRLEGKCESLKTQLREKQNG